MQRSDRTLDGASFFVVLRVCVKKVQCTIVVGVIITVIVFVPFAFGLFRPRIRWFSSEPERPICRIRACDALHIAFCSAAPMFSTRRSSVGPALAILFSFAL